LEEWGDRLTHMVVYYKRLQGCFGGNSRSSGVIPLGRAGVGYSFERACFLAIQGKIITMNEALQKRIRVINKQVTNKVLIHISGRKSGHFAILSHTGRKSGKLYRIPIIAEPFKDGFVIALTYGKKVDWYENVMAKGGCSIRWKNQDYQLINPEFIDQEIGVLAFPKIFQSGLRKMGIEYYLKLEIQPSSRRQSASG
jgi:deazaflavin-dependent oxidoreductase (nitroreductase family)